jgi:hypothetical protein
VEYHHREISRLNGDSFIVPYVGVCISQSNSWVVAKFSQLWMQIGMSVIEVIDGAATTELAVFSYERLPTLYQAAVNLFILTISAAAVFLSIHSIIEIKNLCCCVDARSVGGDNHLRWFTSHCGTLNPDL